MSWILNRVGVPVLALLVTGCTTYQPKPLEPNDELVALSNRTLTGFAVKYTKPGEEGKTSQVLFDLTDGLNEAELIAVALTLNPDTRAKRFEKGEAQAFLITAGLWPNPELGVSWQPGIDGASGHTFDADLLFELLSPWKRSARKDIATARIEEVHAEIVAEEWRLVAEVRSQIMRVLFAEQVVMLLDEEVELRERALELVRRRRDVGEGNELEVSTTDLEAADVRRERRLAQTRLEKARRDLNRLLGLPPDYELSLSDSGKPLEITVFKDISNDELEQRLLEGRFELRAMESAYMRAEHELRLAVYEQYPGLKLGPSFSRELEGDKSLGLGLSLELPFFDRNQGEIIEKETKREKIRAKYSALLHRLKADAYEALGQLQRANLEVEAQQEEILPLVERSQSLFEGALKARALSVLEVVTVQQRTLSARKAYLDALARYQLALIQLETAMGIQLSRSIDEGISKKRD